MADRPRRIKMQILPMDDGVNVDSMMDSLAQAGFLIRYEVGGEKYCQIVNFTKHQNPHHKEVSSEIPPPEGLPAITRHGYDVSKDRRLAILERDGACLKCGSLEALTIDHIVPLSKGGDNSDENLQTLCHRCNSAKGDATKSYLDGDDTPETKRSGFNHGSTLDHACANVGAPCPPDPLTLIPDPLIPDSLNPEKGQGQNTSSAAPTDPGPNPEPLAEGFEEFWAAYPKKVDKKNALAAWKAKKLNGHAQEVIEHVRRRVTQDKTWLDGFVMSPKRFLREERWNDQYTQALSHREKVLRALEDRHNPVIEGRLTNGQ